MNLSVPDPNLKVCVVVPARNEETLITACLESLANQVEVSKSEYEVILILDDCTDDTEKHARLVSEQYPEFRLQILYGPGKGAGQARHLGMETACSRLLELGKPDALISSTDADTVVAPDWLSAQLKCAGDGAQAIGGRILLDTKDDITGTVFQWHSEMGQTRYRNLLTDSSADESPEHWQFSGASMSLTAAVYKEIGGLEPRTALEDEQLERALRQRGIPIERPLSVKVKTSARLVGRASRGLARDLALASWIEQNTYRAGYFKPGSLSESRREKISAILPLLDEPATFDGVLEDISSAIGAGAVDEAILVSTDQSLEELPPGIEGFRGADLMPDFGPVRGRGDTLWRGLSAAEGDVVVFLDPANTDCVSQRISNLVGPMLEREELQLVKGFRGPPGQLVQLVARPFINLHVPHLAGFVDPLYTEFAARGSLLERMLFPVGQGANISTLIDADNLAGTQALAQSELAPGSTADFATGEDAYAILSAATSHLPHNPLVEDLVPGPLLSPGEGGFNAARVPLEERPPLKSLYQTLPKR